MSTRTPLHQQERSLSNSRQSRLPIRKSELPPRGLSLNRQRNISRSHEHLALPGSSRRSGSCPRNTMTPLTKNRNKSPCWSSCKKDKRPITDKKWQNNQLLRVRNCVTQNFPEFEVGCISPGITIEHFVSIINAYLNAVDKRVVITRDNYVEEVPIALRRLRYMTNIQPSLMKTVNTHHAWPHVLAILSWLTDIIYEIQHQPVTPRNDDLLSVVDNAMLECVIYYNHNNIDAEEDVIAKIFKNQICEFIFDNKTKFYNVDKKEYIEIQHEASKLMETVEEYDKLNNDILTEIHSLQSEINATKNRCESKQKIIEDLDYDIHNKEANLQTSILELDIKLEQTNKEICKLKAIVAEQYPHNASQYEKLTETIGDLENTLRLKEERYNKYKHCVFTSDYARSDLKREIESKVYEYNNNINTLKLENSSLENLQVRESGFARSDMKEEVDCTQKLLKNLIAESENQLKELLNTIKEYDGSQLNEEIEIAKVELQILNQRNAELELAQKYTSIKLNQENQSAQAKLAEQMSSLKNIQHFREDVGPLETELHELENRECELIGFQDHSKATALQFFTRLSAQIHEEVYEYANVIDNNLTNKLETVERIIENKTTYINKRKGQDPKETN